LKKIILCSILITLCFNLYIYSQVKEPENPKEPEDPFSPDVNTNIDKDNLTVKTRVTLNGKDHFIVKARVTLQGRDKLLISFIALSSDVLIAGKNRFKISDLTKINILKWKRSEKKTDSYIFYPDRYELFFRDYRNQIVNGNIESLNKIIVMEKKSYNIYLYYYDYFKDNKWTNSGGRDFNAAFTTPIDGTVISIELIE